MASATLAPTAQKVLCTFKSLAMSAACHPPFAKRFNEGNRPSAQCRSARWRPPSGARPRRCPDGAREGRKAIPHRAQEARRSILSARGENQEQVLRATPRWHSQPVCDVVVANLLAISWCVAGLLS